MTPSILADDKETTLAPFVVGKNPDKPIPDPSWLAHEEAPETAEHLFIGPPPGSSRRHVHYAAALSVLAVALTTWLLPSSSHNETDLLPLISYSAAPQQAVPASGRTSAGGYATPLDPVAAYAQFCQNNPTRCVSTTPTYSSALP
jgi:hypothetical protein